MNINELFEIISICTGQDSFKESCDSNSRIEFDKLGIDSLCLLQVASKLEKDLGIYIDSEDLFNMQTPEKLLERINKDILSASKD